MKVLERGTVKYLLCVMASITLLCGAAIAQEDGLTSAADGTFQVSIELTDPSETAAQISGLEDIFLEKDAGTGALADQTMDVCVYMSEGGSYGVQIAADSLSDGNFFYPYGVGISQGLGSSGSAQLDIDGETVEQTVSPFAASTSSNCDAQPTLLITIKDRDTGEFEGAFSAVATVRIDIVPD